VIATQHEETKSSPILRPNQGTALEMEFIDYYATLGVLPEANPVVIKAAYRALAQTYHPDKWHGDPAVASRRMAAINEAYRILGDSQTRAAYDATRLREHSRDRYPSGDESSSERDNAFSSALSETEQRWSLAKSVFPDLDQYRDHLARISTVLSFAFVTLLLETKRFDDRKAIAEKLEAEFLIRYFGSNPKIIAFAKELIASGKKDAAKLLNRLVDVMGTGIEARLLIDRVLEEFPDSSGVQIRELRKELERTGDEKVARRIAKICGYTVEARSSGFFDYKLIVAKQGEAAREFSLDGFIFWVQNTLKPYS
jgi:curved DNA-binding protein CbpA